jgi:hypothetical protein
MFVLIPEQLDITRDELTPPFTIPEKDCAKHKLPFMQK